jgi:hypothetical protein
VHVGVRGHRRSVEWVVVPKGSLAVCLLALGFKPNDARARNGFGTGAEVN